MIKAAIFDLDGVLVDTIPLAREISNVILKAHGITRTEEEVGASMGRRTMDNYTNYIRSRGLDIDPRRLIDDRNDIFFRKIKGRLKPFPGAAGLIEKLESLGFRMAVASGSEMVWVEACLKEAGLSKRFSVLVSSDDVKNGKPNPEPFLLAAKRLGAKPSECVVFEDAGNGIEAAKAAGMKCVGITNTPGQDISAADLVVKSLEEVSPETLRKL